jgi:hypothetical protein
MIKYFLVGIVLIASIHAQAKASRCEALFSVKSFSQVKDSQNLSQLIRSNTNHYWGWMKRVLETASEKDKTTIEPYLTWNGMIMGDPHLGNFSVIQLKNKDGKPVVGFKPVDFDDVGYGPFVVDFARFVVATEAISPKIKKGRLTRAYIAGLSSPHGKFEKLPKNLKKTLDIGNRHYAKEAEAEVANHVKKEKFELKPGELEAYKGELVEGINEIFSGKKVLDIAERKVERGGSKEALRIWVLVREESQLKIYEIKEKLPSGVEAYQDQPTSAALSRNMYKILWPDTRPEEYQVISLNGQPFWLREKKPSLVDIPYSANTKKEVEFIQNYAELSAFALGQIHGRQNSGQQFLEYILSTKDGAFEFKEAIEPFIREYLDFAVEELKQSQ